MAKSSTRDAYAYTLIDTDSAIDSDFAQFTVAGMDAKQVDFLTVDGRVNADDDTRYDVTASLSGMPTATTPPPTPTAPSP